MAIQPGFYVVRYLKNGEITVAERTADGRDKTDNEFYSVGSECSYNDHEFLANYSIIKRIEVFWWSGSSERKEE